MLINVIRFKYNLWVENWERSLTLHLRDENNKEFQIRFSDDGRVYVNSSEKYVEFPMIEFFFEHLLNLNGESDVKDENKKTTRKGK